MQATQPSLIQDFESKSRRTEISGRRFAKTKRALLPVNSKRVAKLDEYASPIANGWFADVNLDHDQKFSILVQLCALCHLHFGEQWDFQVTGATRDLLEHQRIQVKVQEIIAQMKRAREA